MVGGGRTPLFVRIEIMIVGAALVGFGHGRLRLTAGQSIQRTHPLKAHLSRRMDKNTQPAGVLRERVIRTAADDHARPLLRGLPDRVKLREEHLMVQRHIGVDTPGTESRGAHGERIQQAARGRLVVVLENVLAHAAFLRGKGEQLLVVKRHAALFRNLPADFPAAAAVLPADGQNDTACHNNPLLSYSSPLRFSSLRERVPHHIREYLSNKRPL